MTLELHRRFLGAPRLVGVDHDLGALAHGLGEQLQAGEIAVEVGVADLDLEGRVSLGVGAREKRLELVVRQMVVEAGGIGADAIPAAAEIGVERQSGLLCGQIPERDLQGFLERLSEGSLVAAARAVDAMDETGRMLTNERRPSLVLEDSDQFVLGRQGME